MIAVACLIKNGLILVLAYAFFAFISQDFPWNSFTWIKILFSYLIWFLRLMDQASHLSLATNSRHLSLSRYCLSTIKACTIAMKALTSSSVSDLVS